MQFYTFIGPFLWAVYFAGFIRLTYLIIETTQIARNVIPLLHLKKRPRPVGSAAERRPADP